MTGKFTTAREVVRWVNVHLQRSQPLMLTERGGRCHTGVFRGLRGGVLVMGRIGRSSSSNWTIPLTDIAEIECSINP